MNSIEREFKSEISRDEYQRLIEKYKLEDKIYWQINHYFDTKDFALQSRKMTLRIREKVNNYHLTLKQKREGKKEILEQTFNIEKEEGKNKIQNGFNMKMFGADLDVYNYCSLKTNRAKMSYKNGVIFIDHNSYFDKEDFEIEFEINEGISLEEGEKEFFEFLAENDLKFKKQISKNKRAYKQYKAA